jgi:hypothetical protein
MPAPNQIGRDVVLTQPRVPAMRAESSDLALKMAEGARTRTRPSDQPWSSHSGQGSRVLRHTGANLHPTALKTSVSTCHA